MQLKRECTQFPVRVARIVVLYDPHGEKLRFVLVGIWNTVCNYLLFALLLHALAPPLGSLAATDSAVLQWVGERYYLVVQEFGWLHSVAQSTLAFRYMAFRSKGPWLSEVGRSLFVYLPLQMLSSGLLWLFSTVLGLHPLLGQALTVVVSAVLAYYGHKYFLFRTPVAR